MCLNSVGFAIEVESVTWWKYLDSAGKAVNSLVVFTIRGGKIFWINFESYSASCAGIKSRLSYPSK